MFHHQNYNFAPFTGSFDSFGRHHHNPYHASSSRNGWCHRGYRHPGFTCAPLRFARFIFGIAAATVLFSFVFKTLFLFLAILLSPPVLFFGIGALLSTNMANGSCFRRAFPCGSQSNTTRTDENTTSRRSCRRSCGNSTKPSSPCDRNEVAEESPFEKKTVVNTGIHREETEEHLKLSLDVPGFDTDLITVSVEEENKLLVLGTRFNRLGDAFEVNERFSLDPEIYDHDTIQVELSEGVLDISIQKKPAPKPRVIAISTK